VSYLDVQDEIVALLREIPHVDVYEGQMDDEAFTALLTDSNSIKPFITVSFGGLINPTQRNKGIVGARKDSQDTTFVVRTVASSDRTSRQVLQLVLDKLVGYSPSGCGEITSALFGGTGQVSSLGNPTRFAAVQALRVLVNEPYSS
jgi:phage gp37-like protein